MILWLLKRKLRRHKKPTSIWGGSLEQIEESPEERETRRLEEHFESALSLGMMKACYFSSKAADEARGGPLAVLRNATGQRITARVEAPYVAPR